MMEMDQNEIRINAMDGAILEDLIAICYGGEMKINEKNVDAVIAAGSLLQINEVLTACLKLYLKILSPLNCLGLWALAMNFNMHTLQERAFDCALENFQSIIEHEEFAQMDDQQLSCLLRSEIMNIDAEIQVFDALMKWIQVDEINRRLFFKDLVKYIRVELITNDVSYLSRIDCCLN